MLISRSTSVCFKEMAPNIAAAARTSKHHGAIGRPLRLLGHPAMRGPCGHRHLNSIWGKMKPRRDSDNPGLILNTPLRNHGFRDIRSWKGGTNIDTSWNLGVLVLKQTRTFIHDHECYLWGCAQPSTNCPTCVCLSTGHPSIPRLTVISLFEFLCWVFPNFWTQPLRHYVNASCRK